MTISIGDPDDPRIAGYRELRERDLVGRAGGFIAEGVVVLHALVEGSSRHRVDSVLLAENRVQGLASLLARLPAGVPVYAAPQPVLERIAGMPMHRGVLALGRQAPPLDAAALLGMAPPRAAVVVFFGIANHDNIGGIFRNAAAFGALGVILDETCCDPFYRKAIRVSVGATLTLPFARLGPGEDALALLAGHAFEPLALSPQGVEELAALKPPARAALLLGTEGPGLPPALLARTRSLRIAMAAGWDSLNVATASGIALHHLTRAGMPAESQP